MIAGNDPQHRNLLEAILARLVGRLIGISLVLLATTWLLFGAQELALPFTIFFWVLVLFLWLWMARRSHWVGPVLVYDFIRQTRRSHYRSIRLLYLGGLFILLCWIYLDRARTSPGGIPARELPYLVESFFSTFVLVQLLLVIILTPAVTATAIAEEKEKQTLPYLLASELSGPEIVVSKYLSRLSGIFLALLAGLPVLSFLQFLGGIDPGLLLATFAATLMTVLSLASVGILFSALVPRGREAIAITYFIVPLYLVLTLVARLVENIPGATAFPSTATWTSPITLGDLVVGFRAGNPFLAFDQALAFLRGASDQSLWTTLKQYLLFHLAVIGVGLCAASWGIRRWALKEASSSSRREQQPRRRWLYGGRPAMLRNPVLWKEVYAERGPKWHWLLRTVFILGVIASFFPVIDILYRASTTGWFNRSWQVNIWGRLVGTTVGCLLLLGIAVRAACCFTGERDRHTYDGLILTPLASEEILLGKWLGNIASVGWGWLWLLCVWAVALLGGGLHPAGAPFYLFFWFIYAGAFSIIGVWFSLNQKTTSGAIVRTLLVVVGLSVGQWLLGMCCMPLGSRGRELIQFLAGTSPPAVLVLSQFSPGELSGRRGFFREWLGYSLIGGIFWFVLFSMLWRMVCEALQKSTGRGEPSPEPSESSPASTSSAPLED